MASWEIPEPNGGVDGKIIYKWVKFPLSCLISGGHITHFAGVIAFDSILFTNLHRILGPVWQAGASWLLNGDAHHLDRLCGKQSEAQNSTCCESWKNPAQKYCHLHGSRHPPNIIDS